MSRINAILSSSLRKLWIIHDRQTLQTHLKNYVTCKTIQRKTIKPSYYSSVPNVHIVHYINCNNTFENTGLDCTEPFFIKDKRKTQKCFVLLFTFITTRAMHLELSTNVSASVLILTIRRFSLGKGYQNYLLVITLNHLN